MYWSSFYATLKVVICRAPVSINECELEKFTDFATSRLRLLLAYGLFTSVLPSFELPGTW